MKRDKNTFIILGSIVGLICGISIIVTAYVRSQDLPGMFEICMQLLIIALTGCIGLSLGFITTIAVGLFRSKKA